MCPLVGAVPCPAASFGGRAGPAPRSSGDPFDPIRPDSSPFAQNVPSGCRREPRSAVWQAEPMEGERCPECDRPFPVVWRVTIGAPKDGYKSAVPPGIRDLARCETCGAEFQRAVDGGWARRIP